MACNVQSNLFQIHYEILTNDFFCGFNIFSRKLLVYEGLSIKEISYQLNYSSVSHLCLQFKKITGQTPSEFKKQFQSNGGDERRNDITYYRNNITE